MDLPEREGDLAPGGVHHFGCGPSARGGRGKLFSVCRGEHFFDGLVERGVAHCEVEVGDAEFVEWEEGAGGGAGDDGDSVPEFGLVAGGVGEGALEGLFVDVGTDHGP